MSIKIDHGKCILCNSCVEVCPVKALKNDGKKIEIDKDLCIDCGACASVCQQEALDFE